MKILGTGTGFPAITLTNQEIEARGLSNSKWIEERLGIKERKIGYARSSDLGSWAARDAIRDARLYAEDIDLIIVATSTPDKLNPSTACLIQDKIGAKNAHCFDLNAVCSGFVYGLVVANQMFSKSTTIALVIGVDTFSKITDWTDRNCVFFGDGAGAVVCQFTHSEFHYHLGSDGGSRAFETEHGGYFKMNPKEVYKAGLKYLPDSIETVLKYGNSKIKDISWLLPHQASIFMLRDLAKKINLPWCKVKYNMDRYGNTAAASIPILLHESKKDFKEKDKILLAAIGSGWTYGSILLEW